MTDLVGAVQSFGLSTAAAVVDRYAGIVDRALTRDVPAPVPLVQVAEAWLRLLDNTSAMLRSGVPREESLVLPPTAAGCSSEAALWIHNTTTSPVRPVDLHATSLVCPTGPCIGADAVSFSPDRIDRVDAGTSREVRVQVRIPPAQPAAEYHGLVVSSAAPEPLVLRLEVRGR